MSLKSLSRPSSWRIPAWWPIVVMVGLAVFLVLTERAYRAFEVHLSGLILRMTTDKGVLVAGNRESVYFGLGGDNPLGLRMTPECSSVFMLLPLFLASAVMLYLRPQRRKQLLLALAASAAVVILVNQARVLVIVGLVEEYGTGRGYYWGHTLMGSMVSIFGGAVALVLYVWLSTRKTKKGAAE